MARVLDDAPVLADKQYGIPLRNLPLPDDPAARPRNETALPPGGYADPTEYSLETRCVLRDAFDPPGHGAATDCRRAGLRVQRHFGRKCGEDEALALFCGRET